LQAVGSDDWMTTILQTSAFHRIPPANIQAIFQRLQRRPCKAGEVVIKQGDEGDYFYIIVNGKCAVTRETPLSRDGIKLAELSIEGAVNVPLYLIRLKLSTLDRNTPYVAYCDTGRRSSAAAYILVERGFNAYVLTGGMNSDGGLPLTRGGPAPKP